MEPATDTCVELHKLHVSIDTAAETFEKVSMAHNSHSEFPSGFSAYVPGRHGIHSAGNVRASRFCVDVPSEQALHEEAPFEATEPENLPAMQFTHTLPLTAPSVTEYVPAEQLWHDADPLASLYVPISHSSQPPPSGPVEPTSQIQSMRSSLPAGASELIPHCWHVFEVAPVSVEYLPEKQIVHATIPVAILYLPGSHSAHIPPSGPVAPALHVQSVCSSLATGASEYMPHC